MTGGADKADGLASAASSAAQALDDYAAELQRAHNDMHAVRAAAATGGLTVNGEVIEEPGPAPAMPVPLPPATRSLRRRSALTTTQPLR